MKIRKFKLFIRSVMPSFYQLLAIAKYSNLLQIYKFRTKYPNVRIFPHTVMKVKKGFYSCDNQDFILDKYFFKGKKKGFFCDVGGNHPLTGNNTKYFEDLGWRGVAFEPLPHMVELWTKQRKAKLFSIALSDNEGEGSFAVSEYSDGVLSFMKNTSLGALDKSEIYDIKVRTRLFKDVMSEENITHIDYLSLDVEGHEMNVLKGIDFNKVRIDVLTIENHSLYGDDNIRNMMINNGYIFWGRVMNLDDIYVHMDYKVS
ncbi:hypothetical protein [uncultured Gammaproteobacteria bacterium]|nr:hypothetical protein [uncultured Gammaproteobacteria bacterium]CAC9608167.1 hypothetical protein [uncultured Gammaproteobacteria bacterium]